LWGSLVSCAAAASRRAGRLRIGPQVTNLPHTANLSPSIQPSRRPL
jgi:hypothetical protein